MLQFFRKNLSLKVASLALAIGVWAYVRGEERPIQIFSVPLDLQNLPRELTLYGSVPETVNVRVRARETLLRSLGNESLIARVDLAGLDAGPQSVRVGAEAVRTPPGVEVVRVTPEFLDIRLETKVQSEVPITARVVGIPASGFALGGTRILPPRARIEGPESAMAEAHEVDTETIRIDGRSQPFEVMVDLYPSRPDVRVLGDGKALVQVEIRERFVTRTIPDVPVIGEGRKLEIRLDPQTVEVTLEGPPAEIEGLGPEGLSAVVDLSAVAEGSRRARLEPRIVFADERLNGRVFIRGIAPEAVSVRVLRGPSN